MFSQIAIDDAKSFQVFNTVVRVQNTQIKSEKMSCLFFLQKRNFNEILFFQRKTLAGLLGRGEDSSLAHCSKSQNESVYLQYFR